MCVSGIIPYQYMKNSQLSPFKSGGQPTVRAILVRFARPRDEQNNIDEYYVYLCKSCGCGPRQKITTLFRPMVVKRLPTTDLSDELQMPNSWLNYLSARL